MENIFAVFVETWEYGIELLCYCEGEENARKLSRHRNERGRFDREFRRAFYEKVVLSDINDHVKDFWIFVSVELPNEKGKACGLREECWTSTDCSEKDFPLFPMGKIEEKDYSSSVRFRVSGSMFAEMSDAAVKAACLEMAYKIKA